MQEGDIFMVQEKYTKDVLVRYGMVDCRSVSTPLEVGVKLSEVDCLVDDGEKARMEQFPCRLVV